MRHPHPTAVPHPANAGAAADVNPARALADHARRSGDDVVLRYGAPGSPADIALTYRDLDSRSAAVASVLRARGVEPGDRVAYAGLNSPDFLVTMFAAFRLGAVFVPVNFRLAGPELRAVLDRSGAVAIVAEPAHVAVVDAVRAGATLRTALVVDDDPVTARDLPDVDDLPGGPDGWERLSDAVADAGRQDTDVHAGGSAAGPAVAHMDDPAILMFTSGTTGLPKGVVLTYGNLFWNSLNVDSRIDTRRGDVTYAGAPLFHVGALNSFVVRTIVRGGTVVVRRTFDPRELLDDVVTWRVDSMFAVPAMMLAFSRADGVFDADLTCLRSVVVAGAPVPPALIRTFADHGVLLQQAWGLTETAPFATHLPAERTLDKVGSAGIAMPYTQVRVVEIGDDRPAPAGVEGEILVRGPNVTPGYWENPDATAGAFDAEGWFHSGDIGYLDDEGYLFIVDRLKDMVISGGENIYPAEVERVLAAMPGIVDVAVVGAADDDWGEVVVAVVAVDPDAAPTLEAVRAYAADHLARYKLPRRLEIVDQVPRNASGKLEKKSIRAMLASDTTIG